MTDIERLLKHYKKFLKSIECDYKLRFVPFHKNKSWDELCPSDQNNPPFWDHYEDYIRQEYFAYCELEHRKRK